MVKFKRKGLWPVALSLAVIALTSEAHDGSRHQGEASAPSPRQATRVASAMDRMEGYFPNVALQTHDGETVRFYDDLIKGKSVIISFMYTSCATVCPLTTKNLMAVQNALGERVGKDVFLYAITLDPAHDTPAVLRRFARAIGAQPGLAFVTGAKADIDLVRRKLGVYDPDPVIDADKSQHGALFVYGNEATGKWQTIPSMLPAERIVESLQAVM